MLIFVVYLCCTIMCLTFCIPCYDVCYGFHMDTMFGSSLPSVVCREGSCLVYVVCACLHVVVSGSRYVVYMLCFSLSCVPCVASLSGLPIFDFPSVFSDVYCFFILVIYTVNQVHHGNIVCLWIEINNICPSYIEKALLLLNAQMA